MPARALPRARATAHAPVRHAAASGATTHPATSARSRRATSTTHRAPIRSRHAAGGTRTGRSGAPGGKRTSVLATATPIASSHTSTRCSQVHRRVGVGTVVDVRRGIRVAIQCSPTRPFTDANSFAES